MKFALPRRHRKSFEVITKKKLDDNINKSEAIQICTEIKKAYDNTPQTFGSSNADTVNNLEDMFHVKQEKFLINNNEYRYIDVITVK